VLDVPSADSLREPSCGLARPLDPGPEVVVLEDVGLDEAGQLRILPQQSAHPALAA